MTNCNATLTVVDLEPCEHDLSWGNSPFPLAHGTDCILHEGEWRQTRVWTHYCGEGVHPPTSYHWHKPSGIGWRDGEPGATRHVDPEPTEDEIRVRAEELHDEHCGVTHPFCYGWKAWAKDQLLAEREAS